ncbi:MAG TPA: TlpA disulfide reductase family protein [Chthonomonadaceae bacterium]|nr:TlpA disulfide reductase family protein [Chthonomonadaceae bacterium]
MNLANARKSSDGLRALRAARTISFTARTWMALPDDDGRPKPGLLPGQAFAVKARRPGSLRIDEDQTDAVIEEARARAACFVGTPYGVFISDGVRQVELCLSSGIYVEGTPARSLSRIEGQRGLPDSLSIQVLLGSDPLRGLKAMGHEPSGDAAATVYAGETIEDDRRARTCLYVGEATGLPVRYSRFKPGASGEWGEVRRIDYSDWELSVELPDTTFDTTLPPGMKPEPPRKPWFDPRLKPGMMPAPIDASDLAGDAVSLDAYLGKVVLLDYWATWCQPCRMEMARLKDIYAECHPRGLEVIGISLDRAELQGRMLDCLKEKGIPWRQICDTKGFESPLATPYQIGAIPFTLLIGRDGRIAAVNLHEAELEAAVRHVLALPAAT